MPKIPIPTYVRVTCRSLIFFFFLHGAVPPPLFGSLFVFFLLFPSYPIPHFPVHLRIPNPHFPIPGAKRNSPNANSHLGPFPLLPCILPRFIFPYLRVPARCGFSCPLPLPFLDHSLSSCFFFSVFRFPTFPFISEFPIPISQFQERSAIPEIPIPT